MTTDLEPADIVLATINAKFQHAAFGLRYLYANMGALQPRTRMLEWSLGVRERDVVEQILELQPRVLGVSVYIWNLPVVTTVVAMLKRLRPELLVVVGGPEVSYEWEELELYSLCDYLVRGEGDLAFSKLCTELLQGKAPAQKVIAGGLPPLPELESPYPHYSSFDLEHKRVVYVEASRGCPFQCHFCLSSLDKLVRAFPLQPFLEHMQSLFDRGVRQFKFVDRTFNLKASTSRAILEFFLERYTEGLFLHFEMIPDRLPDELREVITRFAPGSLQFEVGIQSFNQEVCARIGRRQNFEAIESNLSFLRDFTGVHVHADLIAGLPGEDMESFAAGFDKLYALGVAEIQVGILKRLRGTPITQADPEWKMVYAPEPPYEVLSTSVLSFGELQRLQRFARYWDLAANSGRFPRLLTCLLEGGSAFGRFMAFSDWLHATLSVTSGISPRRLGQALARFLQEQRGVSDAPNLLEEDLAPPDSDGGHLPERQRRHQNR